MKLNENQIKFLQEGICVEIIQALMEEWHYDIVKALDVLYNSDTFNRLCDPATGLYYQSTGYVYDSLEKEITTGTMA